MGASLKAEAISHLEEISSEGMESMARESSIAVILPTTAYLLRLNPPPVRDLIDKGVAVALGTDFNPNAYCVSMVTDSPLFFGVFMLDSNILLINQPTIIVTITFVVF